MCTLHHPRLRLRSVQIHHRFLATGHLKAGLGAALYAHPIMLFVAFCVISLADASLYGARTPARTRGALGLSRRHPRPPEALGTKPGPTRAARSLHAASGTRKLFKNTGVSNVNDITDTSTISRVYDPVEYGADPTGVNDSADAFSHLVSDMWSKFSFYS